MIRRLLLAASLAPLACFGQLQLLQFDGTNETPITGGTFSIGTAAPGDTLTTTFHIRNEGAAAVTVLNIAVAGTGFSLASPPPLPYILAPDAELNFEVNFSPTLVAQYSAILTITPPADPATVALTGLSKALPELISSQGNAALPNGATIDFGQVAQGSSHAMTFQIENPSGTQMDLGQVAVTGNGFAITSGAVPTQLAANQSISVQITFSPTSGQTYSGQLTFSGSAFPLTGLGLAPPLPTASIVFDKTSGTSATQVNVSIELAKAAQVAGTGTLTLAFEPSVAGAKTDPAIQFLAGPLNQATVNISVGDTLAKFANSSADATSFAFQTGTTAGTFTFTLTLPNQTVQTTYVIAPEKVFLDTVSAVWRANDLDINLLGFDNTQSVSTLQFTFYDSNGKVLQGGAVTVDAASDFKTFFTSTSPGGGLFGMRATFPVTGDPTLVASVDVQITNSDGVYDTGLLPFITISSE